MPIGGGPNPQVVAIECLKGSSKADEWSREKLQTGDIVEEVRVGVVTARSPFKGGRSALQKVFHAAYKRGETSVALRVRRGRAGADAVEMDQLWCLVPNEAAGRRQYMLRAFDDPDFAVGLGDRLESECFELQGTKNVRVASALCRAQLKDGYASYPWEKTMRDFLFVPKSSCFLSMLILPTASDRVSSQYNDLDDSLARANAWLVASQASGVPIVFMNVQTEPLLTKISGESASSSVQAGSLSELSSVANAGLYGFEDYHGIDIGVLRSVRLWYAPVAGEFPIEVELREEDSRLGFSISRTEEGFIYISSVTGGDINHPSASQRSGLSALYRAAVEASKLLVVSRVSNEKVLPWMVSSSGTIRCFDTVSLSQKLSLHRHALKSIALHLFLWDRSSATRVKPARKTSAPPSCHSLSVSNSASPPFSQSFSANHPMSSPSSLSFSSQHLLSPPSSQSFSSDPTASSGCSDATTGEEHGGTRTSKGRTGDFALRMEASLHDLHI